jgi:hypothetical protein
MSLDKNHVIHKNYTFLELNVGRISCENPRIVNSITIYSEFDPLLKQYRPICVPCTQIFDPYGEYKFHSAQSSIVNQCIDINSNIVP